jgi:hypothetical protein
MIYQNTWGAFQDPLVFTDPEVFRPERFIENPDLNKLAEYAFGSGRVSSMCFVVSSNNRSDLICAACLCWHSSRKELNCESYSSFLLV